MSDNHKHTVRQGERSEVIFLNKCFIEHGYMVCHPIGTADYDVVVDVNGSLKRVQVKSSLRGNGNIVISKGTNATKNGKGKYPYPMDSIDFFAIHDALHDTWYIIPRHATGDAQQLRLALKSEGKYGKYKDNWNFNG